MKPAHLEEGSVGFSFLFFSGYFECVHICMCAYVCALFGFVLFFIVTIIIII